MRPKRYFAWVVIPLFAFTGCATLGLRSKDYNESFMRAVMEVLPQWHDTIQDVRFPNDHPFIHTRYLFPNIISEVEFNLCLYGNFDSDQNTLWIEDSVLGEILHWGSDESGSPFNNTFCDPYKYFDVRPDSTLLVFPFVGSAHSHTDGDCIPSFPGNLEKFRETGIDPDSNDLFEFRNEKTGFVMMIVCGPEKLGILTRSRNFMIYDNSARKEESLKIIF